MPRPMETAVVEENNNKKKLLLPPPPWIDTLIHSTFFESCSSHAQWYGWRVRVSGQSTNPRGVALSMGGGCNLLCLDCRAAVCPRCTQEAHRGHRAVQVRVSSFQNVVKVADVQPFFDVAEVQVHVSNGYRVVCVNRRPKSTPRWSDGTCKVCSRGLRGDYTFCSIECKVSQAQPAAEATMSSQCEEESQESHASARASVLGQKHTTRAYHCDDGKFSF